jgi:uncharacterized membrane protein
LVAVVVAPAQVPQAQAEWVALVVEALQQLSAQQLLQVQTTAVVVAVEDTNLRALAMVLAVVTV